MNIHVAKLATSPRFGPDGNLSLTPCLSMGGDGHTVSAGRQYIAKFKYTKEIEP